MRTTRPLAALIFGAAIGAEGAGCERNNHIPPHQTRQSALEVAWRCAEESVPEISIRVSSDEAGSLDVEAQPGGSFGLEVGNRSEADAEILIRARSWSEAGESDAQLTTVMVSAQSSEEVSLDPATLGLAGDTFERSGSLVLTAEAHVEGGAVRRSEPAEFAFHPVDGGWRIYDLATRAATYSDGALSPEAMLAQGRVARRLPPGVRLAGHTIGTPNVIPDDWRPVADGPPDDEQGGAQ